MAGKNINTWPFPDKKDLISFSFVSCDVPFSYATTLLFIDSKSSFRLLIFNKVVCDGLDDQCSIGGHLILAVLGDHEDRAGLDDDDTRLALLVEGALAHQQLS